MDSLDANSLYGARDCELVLPFQPAYQLRKFSKKLQVPVINPTYQKYHFSFICKIDGELHGSAQLACCTNFESDRLYQTRAY